MKAAPKKATEVEMDLVGAERAYCYSAAHLLEDAFSWDEHPWGEAFWSGVHEELTRLSGIEE